MKAVLKDIRLSASDLSNNLACNHLTTLDLAVAAGSRGRASVTALDAEPEGIPLEDGLNCLLH